MLSDNRKKTQKYSRKKLTTGKCSMVLYLSGRPSSLTQGNIKFVLPSSEKSPQQQFVLHQLRCRLVTALPKLAYICVQGPVVIYE